MEPELIVRFTTFNTRAPEPVTVELFVISIVPIFVCVPEIAVLVLNVQSAPAWSQSLLGQAAYTEAAFLKLEEIMNMKEKKQTKINRNIILFIVAKSFSQFILGRINICFIITVFIKT